MASLNFNHAQSNSKKWAKKIKLPQMKFFFKKQLLKFSCTHSPLSFCKILKQFLEPIQSYEDKPFLGQKWPICPEQIFFGINYYYFYPPIGPFHCAKFKKISYSGSWVMRLCHFGAQNGLFASKTFLEKIINIIFIYLLVPLKKKNSYSGSRSFLGSKWPICPNENLFRKPVHEPCFFHSCLSTCQKSKSDMNLLVKYWWLKNTEISLAERHFWL